MADFGGTTASAVLTTVSTASAAASGDGVLTAVTIGINAAILIANAAIEIYRKIRDRDKDLTTAKDSKNKKEQ
jgi:hypothetical protein